MISKTDLEKILQAQRFQGGAWQKVIDCSRQYALMKTTGSYMENGNKVSISFSDRERYTEMFAGNLLRAAQDAFVEDALLGAEMQNASVA